MKNKLLKVVTVSTVFAFGVGLFASVAKTPSANLAVVHIDNYDPYVYEGTYYDSLPETSTEGLNGTLRTALTSLIYPKGWYTYGSQGESHLATQLQYADEDPNNSSNMVYLYTRDSVTKNSASSWNREHVWPQSLSNNNWGTDKAGTDLLHIRPTYDSTNNDRGNDVYADTGKANPRTYNGMLYGYESGELFEPLDAVKGDVARIIMYVWVAYKNHYSNLPSITSVFESYNTLLKWHMQDKPDELEGHRNDYSQKSIQKNRNPFVDHPEYAWMIFGDQASSSIKDQCKTIYPADGSGVTPAKKVTSIAISGEANKKEYYVGQSFDPTGLTVTATYEDATQTTVNNDNCVWTPDPLTEGTTTVTCTYKQFTATYSGITVTKRAGSESEFSVEFVSNSESGTPLDGAAIMSTYVKNNTLIKSVTNTEKVFPGENGLKLGSGSASGSISFVLVDEAASQIQSIEITSTKYKSDSGVLDVKLGNTSLGDAIPGAVFSKTLDDINANTLTIKTSEKRALINKIVIKIASSSTPDGGDSSSSVPPTPSSSEQSQSSQSSNPDITSEQSQSPGESSTQPEKKKAGCNGSIVAVASLSGLSALVGLVFIFSKKKK